MVAREELRRRAWDAAASVVDPEIPALTIADLGVLRAVAVTDDGVEVTITPTYTGCPAMRMIELDIEFSLARAGIGPVRVKTVLAPAWSTDWLTQEGRAKLAACGIVPPPHAAARRALFGEEQIACPNCGSSDTERLAEFGSTACKSLFRCRACKEPFELFKCH